MLFFINFFFLSLLFFQYNTNIIVLPFRKNKPNININGNDLSNEFFPKELYTEVLIGDPPQSINININTDSFNYYVQPDSCYDNSPSFYNRSLSKTFQKKKNRFESDDIDYFVDGTYASDLFTFFNSTDLHTNITKERFEFFYSSYITGQNCEITCGFVGLGIKQKYLDSNSDSLLNILKTKRIINDYIWTYEYFDKQENKILNFPKINYQYIIDNFDGLFILGNYSNEYNPNDYDKNNYIYTLAPERDKFLKWELIFHKIYCIYKEKNTINSINNEIYADLSINYDYIISTKIYFEEFIYPFFNTYLEKKICKINQISHNKKVYKYEVISCDKKLFTIKDIKKFPNIYFFHRDYNYTFELTYKELFKEMNNSIFFLILQNVGTYNQNIWKLGKIFLKKYHFSFNQDSKTINFYNNIISNNDHQTDIEKENIKNKIRININYIWIIICVICLIGGIYIGNTLIIRNRKMRANELRDEYEYKPENENDDKKRNLINEKQIEMGIKGLGA